VGVPAATVKGKARAGYVSVAFGGKYGPGPHGTVRVTQSTTGVPGTPESGDRFGAAVATADVDHDGYADLVIGAPGESIVTSTDAGSVTVVHGSATAASTGFARATTAARGDRPGAAYGNALAAADFTGDKRVDLAIGATDRIVANTTPSGARTVPLMAARHGFGGRAPVLATGDFDSDGNAELAVSYYTENEPYIRSYVELHTYGRSGPAFGLSWSSANSAANALAVGDFNGDGRDDLALGNCREIADENIDDPCGPEELTKGGGIHIHYGNGAEPAWRGQTLNQDTPGVPGIAESGDGFGDALTAADVDGDGRDDLVAGAPGEAIGSRAGAGAVTVLRGGAQGILDGSGKARAAAYHQSSPDVLGSPDPGDRFGGSLRTADYDKDGRPDVSVAAPGENDSAGGVWFFPSGAPANGSVVTPNSLALPASQDPLKYGEVLGR
ncbi:FG-GAP repeat protein, partial [Actinomycetota bacterium Odt1-20B]